MATSFVLAACGDEASSKTGLELEDDDDSGTRRETGTTDTSSPAPDGGRAPGRVYGHSENTLYVFEPETKKISRIGEFDCYDALDPVIDIAVTRTGELYATTFDRFLRIDPLTATCTLINTLAIGAYPNSLSFVPGTTKEVLVGYGGVPSTEYVEIDTTTGAMTPRGVLDPTNVYRSSGDIVSLARDNNRTFVTIRPIAGSSNDLLAEIDPANGSIKQVLGETGYAEIFGLGYWAGKGYGFTNSGALIELNMVTGQATPVLILQDDAGAPIPWYGAGVTTDARTTP